MTTATSSGGRWQTAPSVWRQLSAGTCRRDKFEVGCRSESAGGLCAPLSRGSGVEGRCLLVVDRWWLAVQGCGHARIERAMSIFISSIGSDGSFNFTCNSLAVEDMHSPVRRALCVDEDGDEGDARWKSSPICAHTSSRFRGHCCSHIKTASAHGRQARSHGQRQYGVVWAPHVRESEPCPAVQHLRSGDGDGDVDWDWDWQQETLWLYHVFAGRSKHAIHTRSVRGAIKPIACLNSTGPLAMQQLTPL
jgi:hypothetical protein